MLWRISFVILLRNIDPVQYSVYNINKAMICSQVKARASQNLNIEKQDILPAMSPLHFCLNISSKSWKLENRNTDPLQPSKNNLKAMETPHLLSVVTKSLLKFLPKLLVSAECAWYMNKFNLNFPFICFGLMLELGPVCALPCVILPNTFQDL